MAREDEGMLSRFLDDLSDYAESVQEAEAEDGDAGTGATQPATPTKMPSPPPSSSSSPLLPLMPPLPSSAPHSPPPPASKSPLQLQLPLTAIKPKFAPAACSTTQVVLSPRSAFQGPEFRTNTGRWQLAKSWRTISREGLLWFYQEVCMRPPHPRYQPLSITYDSNVPRLRHPSCSE